MTRWGKQIIWFPDGALRVNRSDTGVKFRGAQSDREPEFAPAQCTRSKTRLQSWRRTKLRLNRKICTHGNAEESVKLAITLHGNSLLGVLCGDSVLESFNIMQDIGSKISIRATWMPLGWDIEHLIVLITLSTLSTPLVAAPYLKFVIFSPHTHFFVIFSPHKSA